ncbi:MAG: [FeFe] hydrogenase H-cluster radical SAM maturase HydE [Atribacterota bacterium]|jgi:biotin synthase|nr:[FeFe] hydrogenase H-cluster radical SAM maturase HydE [Atribacterota bacterium]
MREAMNVQSILIKEPGNFNQENLRQLFDLAEHNLPSLLKYANQIRKEQVGDEVHLRGIIEFSNYCSCHCLYCGLRAENRKISRYRLTNQEIFQSVQTAVNYGLKTIVLQSGEDRFYQPEDIARLIEFIKKHFDVAITLSVGEHPHQSYQIWRNAGADRYLLKHETADPILYQKLRPGKNLQDRIECLLDLKDLGYQIGSGNMVGLPGQTLTSLIDDVLLMKKLNVEMAGIGPFLPHPDTPLVGSSAGSLTETLKILAITRIILPTIHLPATTAISTVNDDARRLALESGANVIMPNFTPLTVRDQYVIYPQKIYIIEDPEQSVNKLKKLLKEMNRTISMSYGHAVKIKTYSLTKKEVYHGFGSQ